MNSPTKEFTVLRVNIVELPDGSDEALTKTEYEDTLIEMWEDANRDSGCSCLNNPPCGFCISGYSIDRDEYVELWLANYEWGDPLADEAISDYDRAMQIVG